MITTPNHVHAAPTIAALEGGFHVILDKPLCTSMEEAQGDGSGGEKFRKALFCLTHTYTGYPMIKEAKHQIACWGVRNGKKDLCRISARAGYRPF
jgi:predicted dehydrogenase